MGTDLRKPHIFFRFGKWWVKSRTDNGFIAYSPGSTIFVAWKNYEEVFAPCQTD